MGSQGFRDLDHGDVADDIERARQRRVEGRRDLDDVLVASDRKETFLELRLFRGESQLHASVSRQSDGIAVGPDSQRFQQEPLAEEQAPDFFGAIPGDDDRPGPHRRGDERNP
jgi:hypothetical protein